MQICKHILGQTPRKAGLVSHEQANSVCEIAWHISEWASTRNVLESK